MKRFGLIFFLWIYLGLPVWGNPLVEAARQAGTLDAETAALYQVYSITDPQALPVSYQHQSAHAAFCGTPIVQDALHLQEGASADYRQRLAKTLARPTLQQSLVVPSGRFKIHYDLTGRDAVDPTDADDNGLPDYIDAVAATLDSTWRFEIDILGYRPPPIDDGLGGGDEFDIYILQLANAQVYGLTFSDRGGVVSPSYLQIDNDFTDPIYAQTRGLEALRATVAHEFFHSVQFGYYQGRDGAWWQEACSTWMEDIVYPSVDDYLQYLPSFLLAPSRSLDSGIFPDNHIYGASIFAHFLTQRYNVDVVRWIWEELGERGNAQIAHFDRMIRGVEPGGLASAVSEFAVWNFFTGQRRLEGQFYEEAAKYPAVPSLPRRLEANTPRVETGQVDHLASAYFRFTPRLQPGGITLTTDFERGQWTQQVVLVSDTAVEVRPFNGGSTRIAGWDQYDEVVLILTETDQSGLGFGYSVSMEYDPSLTDQPPPLALRLHQNYPNPFRPGLSANTVFTFELDQASQETALSIFTAVGQLVRRYDLGARGARQHAVAWDGFNQAGKPVESGLYYYVLETGGQTQTKTLAIIRD